jgi:hypothetical protein
VNFTLEDVKAAYTKIGFKPLIKKWIDCDTKRCCPLTAMYLAEKPTDLDFDHFRTEDRIEDEVKKWVGEKYAERYIVFTHAYDKGWARSWKLRENIRVAELGLQIREEFIKEGLITV